MVQLVVARAEAHQVPCLGYATVLPVPHVMHLNVAGAATGNPASLVPVLDEAAQAQRNSVLAAAVSDGDVVALPHRPDQAVAEQIVADRRWERHAVGELRCSGVGVQMNVRHESLTAIDRRSVE
jgi:hypothetical protein